MDFVGTNTTAQGHYSVDRERVGPNAFDFSSGMVVSDSSAMNLNRDALYSGTPRTPVAQRTGITVRRFHAYDAGRAFMSVVVGKNILVEDFIAEKVARAFVNCEPYFDGITPSPCEN